MQVGEWRELRRVLARDHRASFLSTTSRILCLHSTYTSISQGRKVTIWGKDTHFTKVCKRRLGLELEERVVQLLIVDINLAHLGLDPLPRLGLQTHPRLLLLHRVPHRRNTRVRDIRGKLERRFLDTPLSLQIIPLGAPVRWDGDGVSVGLEVKQETRVSGGHVCPFHDFWFLDELLEFSDG